MSTPAHFIEGLLDLRRFTDASVRQAVFRQALAEIALAASEEGPGPLDGVPPDRLQQAILVAREDGLLTDLGFLAPSAAAVALYEIASALPLGAERRDLGRWVLARLYEGNASTFAAIAERMAATAPQALAGSGARARIALTLSLPRWAHVQADGLAVALASRRELARTWIGRPSTGSLPERQLAARVLLRAARSLERQSRRGDPGGLRLLRQVSHASAQRRPIDAFADPVSAAWHRLLSDRESLVWRHVAVARGLVAGAIGEIADEVDLFLDPSLSATEWRRAATSIVASIASQPDRAIARISALVKGPLLQQDPGIAAAMVWGLGPAADAEPEAAGEALSMIVEASPISIAEALVELASDLYMPEAAGEGAPDPRFGDRASRLAAEALSESLAGPQADEGLAALGRAVYAELTSSAPEGLRHAVSRAIRAFVDRGARDAHTLAVEATQIASETLAAIESLEVSSRPGAALGPGRRTMARRASVRLLRDLDANLFESPVLGYLLFLDRGPSDPESGVPQLEDLHERLRAWLLEGEAQGPPPNEPPELTQHGRQLRALLHVIDAEASHAGDDQERVQRMRSGWTTTSSVLLARLAAERRSPLRRAIAATVARAFDAVARDGAADPADILLYAAMRAPSADDLDVLGEASVEPDLAELLRAYARFVRGAIGVVKGFHGAIERRRAGLHVGQMPDVLAPLDELVTELPAGASARTEVLRATLGRIRRCLSFVRSARSLQALVGGQTAESSPIFALDDAFARLAQLVIGARRRCGDEGVGPAAQVSLAPLGPLVARTAATPTTSGPPSFGPSLFAWIGTIAGAIPAAIADTASCVLQRLAELPAVEAARTVPPSSEAALPAWLPARQTIGGFYVHRRLGGGALGTVFIVTRTEDRANPAAERFALKVPDYDATAARAVSEAEFLRMFRMEAGALLSVPEHKNVARFVTFDAGAQPKPILVMELVEGVRLDHLIDRRGSAGSGGSLQLNVPAALGLLDGVLAGLAAMHSVEVGHLDLKPANVIVRANGDPVLVDFGLAGRHIRPSCGTACYCAPEVWGVEPPPSKSSGSKGAGATPMTADIYAFGCLAYEVLTGRTLFEGATDAALISAHLTHDGAPSPVRKLAESGAFASFAAFLVTALRKHPGARATAVQLRRELHAHAAEWGRWRWPIGS